MKPLDIFLISLLIFILFLSVQYFYFYPGWYHRPSPERPSLEEISLPITEIKTFPDIYEKQKGIVLLDLAHGNNFQPEEISLLTLRITSRGFDFEYLKEKADLETKLRFADAFLVILPQDEFSKQESKLIKEFEEKGGKILLIGDPTRPGKINSLATEFGLIFESDYLYNQKENDGNFRYIFITDFRSDSDLTKNLEKIVLYSASSISSPDFFALALTDENTFSSVSETKTKFSPIVLSPDSRVLALSDLTFMTEPYNVSSDNNQFIANLANWITKSERVFNLADFPYFFEREVQLTYADASYLDSSLKLKNFLTGLVRIPKLSQYEKTLPPDSIFIGLFDDGPKIGDFLKKEKISIRSKTVKLEGFGEIERKGASIFYLGKINDRPVLIILSETKDNLEKAIDILVDGTFRDRLVTDNLSIYQIKEEEE